MSYWAKTYGPGEANAVAVDKNGDIIVATEKGRIARIDKEGNVVWVNNCWRSSYDMV